MTDRHHSSHSETGEWKPIEGKTYYGKEATTEGDAFKQEAVGLYAFPVPRVHYI